MKLGVYIGNCFSHISIHRKGNQPESVQTKNGRDDNAISTSVLIKEDHLIYVGGTAEKINTYNPRFSLIEGFVDDIQNKQYFITKNNQVWSSKMLFAAVLKKILKTVETIYPEGVTELILATPSYYSKKELHIIKQGIELTGIQNINMVKAPSAIFNYYKHINLDYGNGNYSLIIHLEGESCCISLIAINNIKSISILETVVLQNIGNVVLENRLYNQLSTTYFNNAIFPQKSSASQKYIQKISKQLIRKVTETKTDSNTIGFWHNKIFKLNLSYQSLQSAVKEEATSIVYAINNLLRDNSLRFNKIEDIFLSGNYYCFDILKDELKQQLNTDNIYAKFPHKAISHGALLTDLEHSRKRIHLDFEEIDTPKQKKDSKRDQFKVIQLDWNDLDNSKDNNNMDAN
ncbi:MAG: Hsp70 family protein, partial [Saprospiraceae bacterium]